MTAGALTEIRLLSTLGKRYGRTHWVRLDRKTPAEAMRWLLSQFPDARRYFATAHERGITFAVFRGRGKDRENIGKEQLCEPARSTITFAPVMQGAKNGGVITTIIGAVLIVVGALGETYGQAFGGGAWGPVAMKLGIAMVAGGVIQMLTPIPRVPKSADSSDNQASYIFNGATNTTAQGNCVPVVYGRIRAGSAVISAGMSAEDYVPSVGGVGPGTPGGGNLKSPYDMEA